MNADDICSTLLVLKWLTSFSFLFVGGEGGSGVEAGGGPDVRE